MQALGFRLSVAGHLITSRWIAGNHQISDDELGSGEQERLLGERYAHEDLVDLAQADLVICFSETPRTTTSRGGRHVELGYALALNKEVWLVGPIENAFHCLGAIRRFEVLGEMLAELGASDDGG